MADPFTTSRGIVALPGGALPIYKSLEGALGQAFRASKLAAGAMLVVAVVTDERGGSGWIVGAPAVLAALPAEQCIARVAATVKGAPTPRQA